MSELEFNDTFSSNGSAVNDSNTVYADLRAFGLKELELDRLSFNYQVGVIAFLLTTLVLTLALGLVSYLIHHSRESKEKDEMSGKARRKLEHKLRMEAIREVRRQRVKRWKEQGYAGKFSGVDKAHEDGQGHDDDAKVVEERMGEFKPVVVKEQTWSQMGMTHLHALKMPSAAMSGLPLWSGARSDPAGSASPNVSAEYLTDLTDIKVWSRREVAAEVTRL